MATLGVPYKLVYVSKNYNQGLTDVTALIEKPDQSAVASPPFSPGLVPGTYYYNFVTQTSDPEGVYVPTVICPSEQSIDTIKIELYKQVFDLQQLTNTVPLELTLMDTDIETLIYEDDELIIHLEDSWLEVEIESDDEESGGV